MTGSHLAVVSARGDLLGQAVRFRGHVLTALHVVDPSLAPARIHLADGRAPARGCAFRTVRTAAQGDVAALRVEPALGPAGDEDLVWTEGAAWPLAVAIVACIPRSAPSSALAVRQARTAGPFSVSAYAYRLPGGERVGLARCDVLFLSVPVPRGWSGAAVLEHATRRIVGTVHGNAEANGGNAVCLLPGPAFWEGL